MNIAIAQSPPPAYETILRATADAGFTMASDMETCRLLRMLAASKPEGVFSNQVRATGIIQA
jgi:hypothetical protein